MVRTIRSPLTSYYGRTLQYQKQALGKATRFWKGIRPMSLDVQPQAFAAHVQAVSVDEAATERKLQWIETALLVGATGIAVVLVSVVSVLIHLS